MLRHGFRLGSILVVAALAVTGCRSTGGAVAGAANPSATFRVADADLPEPLVMIAYGDMRFTDPAETEATQPAVRRALVAKVAAEHPAAIFLNGDLPWHGVAADYTVFRDETAVWREARLRVYPALGNHEFSRCAEAECLQLWWDAFPELRGRRWYSVALGSRVLLIALDTDAPLTPGSEQRAWLEGQIGGLAAATRFVVILLHHPPVDDPQTGKLGDHNVRPNEAALADYLGRAAAATKARFLVSAGHVHNYERFFQDGVTYLVSGGGGARPYPVERGAADLYQNPDFPNYHYVRLELRGGRLSATMVRLNDHARPDPHDWEIRDRFELAPVP